MKVKHVSAVRILKHALLHKFDQQFHLMDLLLLFFTLTLAFVSFISLELLRRFILSQPQGLRTVGSQITKPHSQIPNPEPQITNPETQI